MPASTGSRATWCASSPARTISRSRTWAGTSWSSSKPHALLAGIAPRDHAYFVHSFQLKASQPETVLAPTDYGGPITAVVGRDNLAGTQFHPEKSQATGLRLIANFLRWKP